MIGTGKYSFPGIRAAASKALDGLIAGTAWGAWLVASPLKPALDYLEGWLTEYLTNKGLLIINLGAIFVEGEIDQSKFDSAMDDALKAVTVPGLTDAQKAAIDAKVITAFRKFGRIGDGS